MSKPRIVIVFGDGTFQRATANVEGVDILLLDADLEDEGTELIGDGRYWAGILEPEIDSEYVDSVFKQHCQNKRNQHEAKGFST